MEYLMVGLALVCLTVKGYSGKKTSVAVRNKGDAFLFNFLRMVFCVAIGIVMVMMEGSVPTLKIDGIMALICLLSGISNAALLVGWILAIQKNTMVSVDVGLTVSSLLPGLLCFALFGSPLSFPKMIGFALIIAATVILSGGGKKSVRRDFFSVLWLVIAAVGDGLSGFAQQLYNRYYTSAGEGYLGREYPKSVFLLYTYIFAALALIAVYLIYVLADVKKNERATAPVKATDRRLYIPLPVVIHIAVMAACLFAASYFQTAATGDYGMDPQLLYPFIKGGCIITVNFTAMIFFKEKMTWRSIVGSLVALVGVIVMNIL